MFPFHKCEGVGGTCHSTRVKVTGQFAGLKATQVVRLGSKCVYLLSHLSNLISPSSLTHWKVELNARTLFLYQIVPRLGTLTRHCCGKLPEKNSLKEERFVWTQDCKGFHQGSACFMLWSRDRAEHQSGRGCDDECFEPQERSKRGESRDKNTPFRGMLPVTLLPPAQL